MNKLSDKKIKKLIWGISAVICCLLIYFVCLPFYQHLIHSGGKIEGARLLFIIIFTIFLVSNVFLFSYVVALFLIDCSRVSQQTLIGNKITGLLTSISVLIITISPIISLKKMPFINDLYQAFIFYILFPLTSILLYRFVLQNIKKNTIFVGLASLSSFYDLNTMYASRVEMGGDGMAWGLFILFGSIVVGLVSIVVTLIEEKKSKAISGRAIK